MDYYKPSVTTLLLIILIFGLIAGGCQPATTPAAQPTTPPDGPTPTPRLYPPVRPGDGSDLIDRLLEAGIIRVGIRVWPEAEFSPPAFRGFSNALTGGALNGFEVDLAHRLAEGLGLELELVEAYPPVIASGDWRGQWDIALASLVPFDQAPGASGEPGQSPLFFSKPYGYMPMGLLIPANESALQQPEQLAGRRVGVLEHSAYQYLLTPREQPLTVNGQPLLPPLLTGVQPVPVSNLIKAIHQLGQPESVEPGPIALFGPSPIFREAVESGAPVQLMPGAQQLGLQPLAVATVPRDGLQVDRLLAEINTILDRLQRRGILAEMYLRWYGQDYSTN